MKLRLFRVHFSPTDWFFFLFLIFGLSIGVYAYFAEDRDFWWPIAETTAYFVAASLFVNLYRLLKFRLSSG